MAGPSDNGLNFLLPWGMLEWLFTFLVSSIGASALWLLTLGRKVDVLQNQIDKLEDEAKGERTQMKDEIKRLEEKVERLTDKLEAVREELPSRQFIEGQLNNLGQRIDWTIANRGVVIKAQQ